MSDNNLSQTETFRTEQERLCKFKFDMLVTILKQNYRPLTKNDFYVRGYRCNYTDDDFKRELQKSSTN
jgi:hypothetical protein